GPVLGDAGTRRAVAPERRSLEPEMGSSSTPSRRNRRNAVLLRRTPRRPPASNLRSVGRREGAGGLEYQDPLDHQAPQPRREDHGRGTPDRWNARVHAALLLRRRCKPAPRRRCRIRLDSHDPRGRVLAPRGLSGGRPRHPRRPSGCTVTAPRLYALVGPAYLAALLALDTHVGYHAQLPLGALTWAVLLAALVPLRPLARAQTLGVVAFATIGEVAGSLVWGVYTYRLHNLPLFIPPAHGLVY